MLFTSSISPLVHCIVTAGPTFEPLDDVRRLTNFSTGRLGSELVNFLAEAGHEVTLLIGQQATWRGERRASRVQTFTTTADLRKRLRVLARRGADAVFHAAAVSDFAFGKVWQAGPRGRMVLVSAAKIPTRSGVLRAELVPTPKIIKELRAWYPKAMLAGWKYEADGTRKQAIEAGLRQLSDCDTDICVVNGPAYGNGFGLVDRARANRRPVHLRTAARLFAALEERLRA